MSCGAFCISPNVFPSLLPRCYAGRRPTDWSNQPCTSVLHIDEREVFEKPDTTERSYSPFSPTEAWMMVDSCRVGFRISSTSCFSTKKVGRIGCPYRNLSDRILISSRPPPCAGTTPPHPHPPPLPLPSVLLHPRNVAWPRFRWIRHTSPPFGSRRSSMVRPLTGVSWKRISPFCYPGINFTLCWICGYVLIKKKTRTLRIMLGVVIFQWLLSTVHVSLGFTVRAHAPSDQRIRKANTDLT